MGRRDTLGEVLYIQGSDPQKGEKLHCRASPKGDRNVSLRLGSVGGPAFRR